MSVIIVEFVGDVIAQWTQTSLHIHRSAVMVVETMHHQKWPIDTLYVSQGFAGTDTLDFHLIGAERFVWREFAIRLRKVLGKPYSVQLRDGCIHAQMKKGSTTNGC